MNDKIIGESTYNLIIFMSATNSYSHSLVDKWTTEQKIFHSSDSAVKPMGN
jgi:hypothetical protein